MTFLVLFLATGLIFLALDAVGLTFLIRPHFERYIGDLLVPGFRILPAALFYAFYVGVLVVLVSLPAFNASEPYGGVILKAALIGAVAYGTYEFTNLATLEPWHWTMVALDVTWGTLLTASSVTAGLWIARMIL